MSKRKHKDHSHIIPHQGEPEQLAARLAPPEERGRQAGNNGGAIVVGADDLKLPKDFTEREEGKSGVLGMDPIGAVILAFALAFIAFIAYLISIEPPKTKDDPGAAASTSR